MSNNPNNSLVPSRDRFFLILAVAASLLLHLLYLASLHGNRIKPPVAVFSVDFLPTENVERPINKKLQIVAPSENQSSAPVKPTNQRSERDSSTEQEQIKKGDDPRAAAIAQPDQKPNLPISKPAANTASNTAAPKQELKPPLPNKPTQADKLDLSTDYGLIAKLSESQDTKQNQPKAKAEISSTPFSRAAGASAAFVGQNGVPDYIPGIRDGDITLLNAKADKFAVFVRRVAIQVFNYIKQMEWQNLSAEQISAMVTSSMIVASLNKAGDLQSVRLVQVSGSTPFDTMLEQAVTKGAHDPNPPQEALAEDGTFRFIFMAKSWARFAPASGSSRGGEQRWLMLQTGLE